MLDRADRQVYKSISQFRLETATIVHNAVIFFGGSRLYLQLWEPIFQYFTLENSICADAARAMQQDCLYELNEMKLCKDCYRRSILQEDGNWFRLPCDPQHELVYAKAKGFPYWPAKANHDVKFIFSWHISSYVTLLGSQNRWWCLRSPLFWNRTWPIDCGQILYKTDRYRYQEIGGRATITFFSN